MLEKRPNNTGEQAWNDLEQGDMILAGVKKHPCIYLGRHKVFPRRHYVWIIEGEYHQVVSDMTVRTIISRIKDSREDGT